MFEKLDKTILKHSKEKNLGQEMDNIGISKDTINPDISLEIADREPEIPALPDTHRRRR